MKKLLIQFLAALCFTLGIYCGYVQAGVIDTEVSSEIYILKGELETIDVSNLTRISIVDPGISDIIDVVEDEVTVIGKSQGQTALFIWDDAGKHIILVHVFNDNPELVKERIKRLFRSLDIHEVSVTINEDEEKVVLRGEIPEYKSEHFDIVLQRFKDADILNLVQEEEIDDLVQISMQFTELTETFLKSLGLTWSTDDSGSLSPTYVEDVPIFDGSVGDLFKIGDFTRTGQIQAAVSFLVSEGKGRVLSRPSLMVRSGESADFLVGGEVPIRTTTATTSGSTQENIEFKDFGIGVSVTPEIQKEKIAIELNIEVSEIDVGTATDISEDLAFTTTSASTNLLLNDKQTIIIAGFIRESESETGSQVPYLGKIPIVGLLFRSSSKPRAQKEVVISLTPEIVEKNRNVLAMRNSINTTDDDAAFDAAPTAEEPLTYINPTTMYKGIPKEMEAYIKSVQSKISRAVLYPQEAADKGWEGTVKLGLLILSDGTLAFASVKQSSGYSLFDEATIATAKKSAPYEGFPSSTDLSELNVTIPIVYSLSRE